MLAFAGSDTLTRDKMEKGTRDLIAKQMDVFMPKFPNASLQQIRDFLFSGQSGDEDLNTVGKNTLFRFIQRMKKKFIQTGSCLVRRPGSGRPAAVVGDKKLANQVSRKFLNKETPGQRSVAEMFNISRTSVRNILKTKNIKPYHKVREQALLLLKLDENYSKYICKFLILLPFSFLLITWVNLCRIQVFKRLKYSTGREKFKTDLIYLLLTRLKG